MKNTVFPHKLWRPFWMECLGYFLDPNGYASNQDTASYQHHSGIEITIKNMIAHMLSEQLYLFICLSIYFIVFIHVIPGTWSISKYCSNCIRIPSWLRKSHCGERRSHQRLISAGGLFPAIWRFFFTLNQSQAASFQHKHVALTTAPKFIIVEWLVQSETKTSAYTWQHAFF